MTLNLKKTDSRRLLHQKNPFSQILNLHLKTIHTPNRTPLPPILSSSLLLRQSSQATKKPRSKSGSAKSATKGTETSENNNNQELKRVKNKAVDSDVVVQEESAKKTGHDTKKQLFQRLWSEEDEIVILKGMIEYTAKKGSNPLADVNAFYLICGSY
ncbi:probable transcription factor At4g00390 [Camellia sinensis]|uniref:probable transcription factor At4g00390 n=1 Tax=Camellia sinensis TaxID=4442 RepID=UPI001036B930|nr:probable transcription factor At4g00390 [Camellia sinensis]